MQSFIKLFGGGRCKKNVNSNGKVNQQAPSEDNGFVRLISTQQID